MHDGHRACGTLRGKRPDGESWHPRIDEGIPLRAPIWNLQLSAPKRYCRINGRNPSRKWRQNQGETLSEFVEQSVRAAVQRRIDQSEFIARGMASLDHARDANETIDADIVIGRLQSKLDSALTRQAQSR